MRSRLINTEFKMFLVIFFFFFHLTNTASSSSPPLANPGCQSTCGDISIPFPFGIGGPNCSINNFAVICNDTFTPPKPFIQSINLELLQISVFNGTVQVNSPVIAADCPGKLNPPDANLSATPFSFSDTFTRFTAMGCNNLALISQQDLALTGCVSICNRTSSSSESSNCYGIGCCQTKIPRSLQVFNLSMTSVNNNNYREGCKYAFMVDQQWFTDSVTDINSVTSGDYVPAVLDWSINGTCLLCGANTLCSNRTGRDQCFCQIGYEGNPYLSSGCQDIDECANSTLNRCEKICVNTPGAYYCSCPAGYVPNGFGCFKMPNNGNSRGKVVLLGTSAGLGVLCLLIGVWWLWKVVNKRKQAKLKEKFFKRNGGLLLQQQLSSDKGNVDANKLFTSKELEKATDHYNIDRVLGQGGQGTVYKGMLTDGRIVAIKKSKMVDEGKLDQFINEVAILSQINHRNVVRLLGCCLETEVPMLVYEFIPNGTLLQYIHDQNEEFPLSWDLRLRIAIEIAGALSYLHSAASIPIYHRDIKSSNILLDEKYRAKVSDFGISRSVPVDQTHLTTLVQGTFGYLDPEYFQSSQFTEKSDVYSFGVVLVELLTGQKAISSARSEEGRSLATYFILTMEENRLFDVLDARVAKEGGKEEILAVANLAKRCLNLSGRKRPTMKEVVMELEGVRLSNGTSTVKQNCEEVDYAIDELTGPWEGASTSTGSFFDHTTSTSFDVQPLLFGKTSRLQ